MDMDLLGSRLFIAALGNGSVEVIDLKKGMHIRSISGLQEPQGIVYLSEFKQLVVASAGDGTVKIFDSSSFKLSKSIDFSSDADNLRYDAIGHHIYVGYGDALGVIDARNSKRLGDLKLAGHPESFRLETKGHQIFVNVPAANQVAVFDSEKGTLVTSWILSGVRENFPMSLDETNHRLFLGLRNPARMLILNTQSGKTVATLSIARDADDIFYDAIRKRIYVSCGEGYVNIFEQRSNDEYVQINKIPTATGARTSLFVPELNRLYVAVPHYGSQQAEVRVYQVLP
jgi:DNA-binding beta-propeller fold protein YncE